MGNGVWRMEMERMDVAAVERKAGERRGGAQSRRYVIFFNKLR
jgi:hypothetical protein